MTLDERLERKLTALRKYRGTIRFFENHRSLLASGESRRRRSRRSRCARPRAAAHDERRRAPREDPCTRRAEAGEAPPAQGDLHRLRLVLPRRQLAIAWCESRLDTTAQNGQYLGLFQMGSYERSLFGHGATAHDQALAAHRYFVRSGRDWSPWGCRWAAY